MLWVPTAGCPWCRPRTSIAGVLFILSLAGLSHQKTAKAGNTAGKIGMGLALAATVLLALLKSEQSAASHRGADRRGAADRRGDRHDRRAAGRDDRRCRR